MLQGCAALGVKATPAMYNNGLTALARRGRPAEVREWAEGMVSEGIKLDRVAANTLVKALCDLGQLGEASTLLTNMMRAESLPPPDNVSFNTLISALSHAGESHKAEEVLNTMADTGLAPDAHSFTGVIYGYARAGQPDKAARLLHRMLSLNVPPDTAVFNSVLLAYANKPDATGALQTFDQFEQRTIDECPNASPDLVSYNTVISACAREARPVDAEITFDRLVARGLSPDQVAANPQDRLNAPRISPVLICTSQSRIQVSQILCTYRSICTSQKLHLQITCTKSLYHSLHGNFIYTSHVLHIPITVVFTHQRNLTRESHVRPLHITVAFVYPSNSAHHMNYIYTSR